MPISASDRLPGLDEYLAGDGAAEACLLMAAHLRNRQAMHGALFSLMDVTMGPGLFQFPWLRPRRARHLE